MTKLRPLSLALIAAAAGQVAHATPSLLQPGNLAYSCSGRGNGNAHNGINLQDSFYAGQSKCKQAQVALAATAKAKSGYIGTTGGSASANGKAVMGKLSSKGANTTVDNESDMTVAGFVDRWTISVPGLPDSSWLTMTVRLRLKGSIEAHGLSGAGGISANVYRDGALVGYGGGAIRSDLANRDVYLDIDQARQYSFTVWTGAANAFALATTLETSSGVAALGAPGSAKVSTPGAGLVWDGVVELRDYWTGVVYTDWTLTTDSGIDWRQPCPCQLP